MTTTRRAALMGLATVLPLSLAGEAMAKTKAFEIGKLFPYLDLFYSIPAADRTRFTIAYFYRVTAGGPMTITLVAANGTRTPLPLAADGRVTRLPTLADIKGKAKLELEAPEGSKFGGGIAMLAKVAPAATLNAGELSAAILQCQSAIKAKAGLIGFAAPKIKRVVFRGAGSGTGLDASGAAKPLPMAKLGPAYDPEQMPGIVTIKLARAPSHIELDERPKK
ncbi:MAG: hypothetical protein Q7T61_06140 [Caulobacter sp.]|nr:hypothetical protein [Caulobacter sp.]